MRKRTVTTIEMHQIVIVTRPQATAVAWCPACLKEGEMVPLEEAALLAGIRLRDICHRVGADHVHLVETANGALVCLNSLLKKFPLGDGRLNADGADIASLPSADLSDAAE